MSACAAGSVSQDWEFRWAPYDLPTYQQIYAIEINRSVLDQGLASFSPLPGNLTPILADARSFDFPHDISCGVLLRRHCMHFQLYAEKLRDAGCKRLITNARWGMNVEIIVLQSARTSYENMEIGWYACWCGTVGFKSGRPESLSPKTEVITHEVSDCPNCITNELRS